MLRNGVICEGNGMPWYSYSTVWCGMVRYVMVMVWLWYGMVISHGIVWLWYGYGMVMVWLWYGMVISHGMVWYGMVWYGMVWYGMVSHGIVWWIESLPHQPYSASVS